MQKRKTWIAMRDLEKLERELSSWPKVSVHAHRFRGREFRFGAAEIGHVHAGGVVDIPFTRSIHDALLSEGLAKEHLWVPDSGWITFRVGNSRELDHAVWLLRLSYLRYALKTVDDPYKLFENESEKLHLSSRFKALFQVFIPKSARQVSAAPVSA
jgi:hypothetical protein